MYNVVLIQTTGLKPSTAHKVYVNGIDSTTNCDTSVNINPTNISAGTANSWVNSVSVAFPSQVMSDSSGKITFELYLKNDSTWASVNWTQSFNFEIYNSDKTSYASTTYKINIQQPTATTTTSTGGGSSWAAGVGPLGGSLRYGGFF